ncbi:MAG TPA: M20 family metallopeptidase [Chitinivibrionales bacterium]|nr:M20 family metallopeptidase [Chitinivibrionales bacterium]
MKNAIAAAAQKAFAPAVRLRREIHRRPELSGRELATAARVRRELLSVGLSPKLCCNKTGVVASLKNGKGKTVALRADMDALPIIEKTGLAFSSVNNGVMHACGHDMHTAILAGAARALAALRDQWKGTVVFLFQPSEESAPGGAVAMIREGAFPSRASAVFGLHVNPEHQSGTVAIKNGPDYAGVVDFDVVVKGKGGHGAEPEKAIDPIVAAADMVAGLAKLAKKESSRRDPCIVTVGKISAGTKYNIIPEQAYFGGTMRDMSEPHLLSLMRKSKRLMESIARKHKARVEVLFDKSYPPGFNNPALARRAFRVLSKILGKGRVTWRIKPVMLAEDFSSFQKKAPGVYFHLGVRPKNRKKVPGIHTAEFSPDEGAILTGIKVHAAMVMEMLGLE